MNQILYRLAVAFGMEVVLNFCRAPFYLQVFPLAIFLWSAVEILTNINIVKVEVPLKLPKELRQELEKLAKKQVGEARQKPVHPARPMSEVKDHKKEEK